MVLSCSNTSESQPEKIDKPLVFNEFNVDQPRGHFAYIQEQNFLDIEEQRETTVGLLSRGSGVLSTLDCKAEQNKDNNQRDLSSGVLTSSTRFITALHTVSSDIPPQSKVFFGSVDYTGTLIGGDYVEDLLYTNIPNLSYNENYRFDGDEEEPFLAMRLFQLGLKEWADFSRVKAWETRNHIRSWKFALDNISGKDAVPGTFENQGYATVKNTSIHGRDIAVLKAEGLITEIDKEEYSRSMSGKFLVNRPGVFFDHVTPAPFVKIKKETPLWLEHSNEWTSGNTVRLISRPGYFNDAFNARPVKNKCGPKAHFFTGLVGHTLDAIDGSSGGAVIAPNLDEYLPDNGSKYFTQEMVAIGVFHGEKYDPNQLSTSSWNTAGPVNIDEPNTVFDGANVNYFTGISNPNIPQRDTPETPITNGAPQGCREEQNGDLDCLPCEDWNSAGECIKISSNASVVEGENSTPVTEFQDLPIDEEQPKTPSVRPRRMKCAFKENGQVYDRFAASIEEEQFGGMMIGIAGASTGSFNEEEYVSDLYGVCAPVGAVSYTENWRFLTLSGSYLPRAISNVQGRQAWGPLNVAMTESYVINNNKPHKGHKFRPLPMKMCPPNYYMNGLEVQNDGKGVTAIRRLRCHNFSNSQPTQATGGEEIWVNLDAKESGIEGYELFGVIYTLDQRIGNPNLAQNVANGDATIYECDNGFVSGMEIDHNTKGELKKLRLTCTDFKL